MKKLILILFSALLILSLSACSNPDKESIEEIHWSKIYEQRATDYLVYFYMPDCSHCQEFKPILENDYLSQDNALPVYKVNVASNVNAPAWDEYSLEGTPTLIYIKNGSEIWRGVGISQLEEIPVFE